MHKLEKIMQKVMQVTFWSGVAIVAMLGLLTLISSGDCDGNHFSCVRNDEILIAWTLQIMLWVGAPLIGVSFAIFGIGCLIFRKE